MKVYVSGKITGLTPYEYARRFGYTATRLRDQGHKVISPVRIGDEVTASGFDYDDVMHICYACIDVCDAVYMLSNWYDSKGARLEHDYALKHGKRVIYEGAKGFENEAIKSN